MAIKINNNSYSGFFLNGEAINTIYLNGNQVFGDGGSEPQPSYNPLTDSHYFVIKSVSGNPTVTITKTGEPTGSISYRKNGEGEWTSVSETTSISTSTGDYLEMKGDINNTGTNATYRFNADIANSIEVGGWLMALSKNGEVDNSNNTIGNVSFRRLFLNQSSPNTALVSAQYLKVADDVSDYCYYQMFANCSNLIKAPLLPATTLANTCYYGMFNGCSNLTTAPELPATTLANRCYRQMFYNCNALVQAPDLPATTLESDCYRQMFYGCTSLTSLKANFTQVTDDHQILDWLGNIYTTGTLYYPFDATYTSSDVNLPDNWTMVKRFTYETYDYLKGNGSDYIVLNYILKSNTEIEVKYSVRKRDGGVFGASDGNIQGTFEIAITSASTYFTRGSVVNANVNYGFTPKIAKLTLTNVYLDEENIGAFTNGFSTSFQLPLHLFAGCSGGIFDGIIYYVKIWENGVLIHNYLPALINNTYVGVYDTITQNVDMSENNTLVVGNGTALPDVYFDSGNTGNTNLASISEDLLSAVTAISSSTKKIYFNVDNLINGTTIEITSDGGRYPSGTLYGPQDNRISSWSSYPKTLTVGTEMNTTGTYYISIGTSSMGRTTQTFVITPPSN